MPISNSPPSSKPIVPLQQFTLTAEDMKDPSRLNVFFSNLTNAINALAGHSGPISLASDLNLNGNNISGVGNAVSTDQVLTLGVAQANFGAPALQPMLETLGSNILQTMRQLNSKFQKENYSSFLSNLMSLTPAANSSLITYGAPSGGAVSVTIQGGFHLKADGTYQPYASYTDSLTLPTTTYSIATATRSSGVSTITCTAAEPLTLGEQITIYNVSDPSFDGTYVISHISSSSVFQYLQPGLANVISGVTGGTISLGGVYYYYLKRNSNVLGRFGPTISIDTQYNRAPAVIDGQTIIAVVVVNASGVDPTQTAAGATPPASTGNARIINRV